MTDEKEISITQEFKILKAIERVFSDNHNSTIPKSDYFALCPANVSCISAKSDFGKKILLRFLDLDDNGEACRNSPTLDYFTEEKQIPQVKVSIDYLNKLLAIFEYDKSEAVIISVKKDFPITIENKDFRVILAPRITGED